MPGRRLLTNARWIDPEAGVDGPARSLLVENGRIAGWIGPGESAPEGLERIDLRGAFVAPGFLDLHLHGELVFTAHDAIDDALTRQAASCVRHGTTGFLVTTVAWSPERLHGFVTHLTQVLTRGASNHGTSGATPLGIHLEGPWIRPEAAGAQPRGPIRDFSPDEGRSLLDAAEGRVRMVTLAPEIPGAAALLAELDRRRVVAAVGHSLARPPDLDRALDAGLTHVTHLFNAMGPLHQREPGVAARALAEDRLTCDLICDGAHVDPAWVRVAARCKRDRLLLISDRIEPGGSGCGDPARPGTADFGAGEIALHDDGRALRLPDGTLAGSTLTLDRAVGNARRFAGLSLHEAVAACTLRPARLLGLEAERGTLRPGARADLVVLDDQGRVRETWLGGEPVFGERASADAHIGGARPD